LQQPFESLDARFDLDPLVRHSSGRFRQRDALAISDSNYQERQIAGATYENTEQGFARARRVGKLLFADTSQSP
jgi:hypothetical protein